MQLKPFVSSRVKPVLDRYRDLRGREEAAAITLYGLYGLFALFALTVLAIATIGFISADDHNVAQRIVEGLGLHGSAATIVIDAVTRAQQSRATATVVGIVGLIWVGSSFAVTVASAYDHAWGVQQRFARARLVGLVWLLGAGVLVTAGSLVTSALSGLPWWLVPVVLAGAITVNTLLWLWTSWVLTNRTVALWRLIPAAIVGAVGLEALKIVGAFVVPRLVSKSSALYGTIGAVFALIAWLWFFGRLVVFVTILETVQGWRRSNPQDPSAERE